MAYCTKEYFSEPIPKKEKNKKFDLSFALTKAKTHEQIHHF